MTGDQIITHFEWLVDDDGVDSSQELILANEAYDLLLASYPWFFLRSTDTPVTIAGNDKTYALPSDFLMTNRVFLKESATSESFVTCDPVRYEDRFSYLSDPTKYYIDQKNSQLTFCADPTDYAGWLLYHDYQYQPAQLTVSTSPVFNRAFHPIIAYDMAKKYYFNDQGEKTRSWNGEMEREYGRLANAMMKWDNLNQFHGSPTADPYNWAPELSE